jgi:hypothetical protein
MKIRYWGHEFELGNEVALKAAADQRAAEMVAATPEKDRDTIFAAWLSTIISYWLKSGATIAMADHIGAPGISLAQAADMHNFIGSLIGEPPLQIIPDEPEPAGPNDVLEGDQIPGQPPNIITEGD